MGPSAKYTEDEIEAINLYRSDKYRSINDALRGLEDMTSDTKRLIKLLDSCCDKTRIAENLTVFRGISAPVIIKMKHQGILAGEQYQDDGFMSTSRSLTIARRFASIGGSLVTLQITLPAQSRAIILSELVGNDDEQEIIVARGCLFEIESFDKGKNIIKGKLL